MKTSPRVLIQQLSLINNIVERIGNQRAAILFAFLSALIFPFTFIYANEQKVSFIENNLTRGLGLFIFGIIFSRISGYTYLFRDRQSFLLVFIRGSIMALYGFVISLSQYYIPQPILLTINCSGTLFVFLVDYLFNKIQVSKNEIIGMSIGTIGLVIAINGQFIKKMLNHDYQFTTKFKNYSADPFITFIVSILFLGTMFIWANGIVITKRLKLNTIQISMGSALMLSFSSSIAYMLFVDNPIPLKILILNIILGGIPFGFSNMFFVTAAQLTQYSGRITMISFFQVLIGYFISIVIYEEKINYFCILGDLFLVFGVYKVVFSNL